MSQFYSIDSSRVSLREYWWGTRSPLVLIGWILKWLRVRIPSSSDDPNVDSTLPFAVQGLPDSAASEMEPLFNELIALGFQNPVCHLINDPGTQTTIYWVSMIHSSSQHFVRIHHRVWQKAKPASRGVFPMFFTAFGDGTFLVSSSGKPDMAAPDSIQMNRMYRASANKLWDAHQNLASKYGQTRVIQPVVNSDDLMAFTERHHVLTRDFHLARGVFRPRTATEQAQADVFSATVAQAAASGMQDAEVLAELERIQKDKPSWKNAIWILVATAVGFIAAGAAQWNWKTTLWILPVLLFHEAGHWLAMRLCNYRNLRMFFIPFFGAAVTGQNWNVPGWKKALVSLAGPVPGVCLGTTLGLTGLVMGVQGMIQAGLILLLINGFNLLPFLPLDGGHVFHATLFCRNRWLDIVFRALAVGGMLLMGFLGLGKFFMYLAIPLALGLPLAFKMGKITDKLRNSSLPATSTDQDLIHPNTAQTIISAIKAELPPKVSNTKTLAQQTLSIYETLNARPPGILATIGLLTVHAGALVVALVVAIVLFIGKQGPLGNFLNIAALQPSHKLACGSVESWHGKNPAAGTDKLNTIVTTLKDRAAASGAFTQFTNRLPATATLTLIGDSLILTLPARDDAARETWFDEFQSQSTNTFVALSNQPVPVSLNFIAFDEITATNMVQDLQDYFQSPNCQSLIAPWSPESTGPEFEKYRQARRAWRECSTAYSEIWRDPNLESFYTRFASAKKRGATTEMNKLTEEREQLTKKLQDEALEKVRKSLQGQPTMRVVELHSQFSKLNYTNKTERAALLREISVQLGEVSREAKKASPLSAASGTVSAHGQMVRVDWVRLCQPQTSMPALIGWLCDKKCIDIKYEFQEGSYMPDDEDE